MTGHAVVIAGAGPTGMMLAAELALAGIDVALVDAKLTPDFTGSRAGGLQSRTLEVLDQRGVVQRFIAEGQKYPIVPFHIPLNLADFPTRHNYVLALWQKHTERILAAWVDELPVTVYRGREVAGFKQDDDGVRVALADGESLQAQYLVGCDGGRSVVRKMSGIEFPGWDASTSWLLAEVEMTEEPTWGFHETAAGRHAFAKGEGFVGLVITESVLRGASSTPALEDVRRALIEVYGTDFGVHSPRSISTFSDATRQAASYRDRRVLLAGDAAHIHPPMGGQGLNLGVQDAVNLGWKLAQVINGTSRDSLLDTYHAERHPVAARVLRRTMAQVALARTDDRSKALNELVSELVGFDEGRNHIAGELSGLAIRYDLGDGHPLLGRRMPDLGIITPDGDVRVFSLMHDARPLLINFRKGRGIDVAGWSERIRSVDAAYDGAWELPVIGVVSAPNAVLIRPDGYVAWVGEGTETGLTHALAMWFGQPRR